LPWRCWKSVNTSHDRTVDYNNQQTGSSKGKMVHNAQGRIQLKTIFLRNSFNYMKTNLKLQRKNLKKLLAIENRRIGWVGNIINPFAS